MRRSKVSTDRAAAVRIGDEIGSASLEFLTVGMLLLVPIVYLVLSIAAIQGAAFAVEGAARHAARIAADTAAAGDDADLERAVRVTLDDFGVDADTASVVRTCTSDRCDEPGDRISITVRARVGLPLVPDVLDLPSAGSVPVEATATQTVSRFSEVRR